MCAEDSFNHSIRVAMARYKALQILLKVIKQSKPLKDVLLSSKNDSEHSLIAELCYGVCRYYHALNEVINIIVKKPLKAKDLDVSLCLCLGLYQIQHMSIPSFAAVNETVALAKKIRKPWAKGLINATLRCYIRENTSVDDQLKNNDCYQFSLPRWLIQSLEKAYGKDAASLMNLLNQRAQLTLSVNQQQVSKEEYLSMLLNAGVQAESVNELDCCILVEGVKDITQLPGYSTGYFSVQGIASQYAASLIEPRRGLKILDACCAPGGKLCHILETGLTVDVTGIEIDSVRIEKIKENLNRLSLDCPLINKDACELAVNEALKGVYDRILLDAPCSATGVIRKNPDIKIHRTKEQVQRIVALQEKLLKSLWLLLKENGILLYATCSLLPEENDDRIAAFLTEQPDAKIKTIQLPIGMRTQYGWQFLPPDTDGFYYALIEKTSSQDSLIK